MEKPWRPSDAHEPLEPLSVETDTELEYPEPLDQLLINLDHILRVAHGTQEYFETNPDARAFVVQMTMDRASAGDKLRSSLVITPDHVRILHNAAFSTWLDICEHGAVARELANDVVKSWQEPEAGTESPFVEERGEQ